MVDQTIEAIQAEYPPHCSAFDADDWHRFDEEVATAFRARDIEAVHRACRQYNQAIKVRIATSPLQAEVVIEAHGQRFVITPDASRAEHWAAKGVATLTSDEVRILQAQTNGQPLSPETMQGIAATKLQFPGSRVVEAKRLQTVEAKP